MMNKYKTMFNKSEGKVKKNLQFNNDSRIALSKLIEFPGDYEEG